MTKKYPSCKRPLLRDSSSMLRAGVNIQTDPVVSGFLHCVRQIVIYELYQKARILVEKGVLLIGVMDETNTLQPGEVFVQISDENGAVQMPEGETVIVGRSPSLHGGDVRKLRIRKDIPTLNHLVDVVVFSSQGERPEPNMTSGGDLDGDIYFVIWDPRLFPAQDCPPMDFSSETNSFISQESQEFIRSLIDVHFGIASPNEVSIIHVANFFVNHIKNDILGTVANTHLAWADEDPLGVRCNQCLELAKQHSIAVDFAKTGIPASFPLMARRSSYPSFMGNTTKQCYESQKILGQIHRVVMKKEREMTGSEGDRFLFVESHVKSFELDPAFLVTGREAYRKRAVKSMRAYNAALFSLLKHLDVFEEIQVLGGFLPRHMRTKRGNDEQDRILDQVRALKEQYWNVFWGHGCLEYVEVHECWTRRASLVAEMDLEADHGVELALRSRAC